MKTTRRIAALMIVVALAASIAACGRKGDLKPPPGDEDPSFPRSYPAAVP